MESGKEMTGAMEHLRCVVERITYQNAENGYSVIKCRAKGYQDLVTVVGPMPEVHVGSVLYLGGGWRMRRQRMTRNRRLCGEPRRDILSLSHSMIQALAAEAVWRSGMGYQKVSRSQEKIRKELSMY